MRPERSTNLMAGITSGYQQFENFAEKAADALSKYSMQLVITTDAVSYTHLTLPTILLV